jgi:hypothetical protein
LPSTGGRVVYLAKPGLDLRNAYRRVAETLAKNGFEVRPPVETDIPHDDSAAAFIDDALATSEVSIHLVGSDPGSAPAGSERIVQLQLARARQRIEKSADGDREFRRIIWAPKVLETPMTPDQKGDARDPLGELNKLDRFLTTDKVDGNCLSDFLAFLLQNLSAAPTPSQEDADAGPGEGYYVCHRDEDRKFAVEVAKAFKERNIEPTLPALQGDMNDRRQWHRKNLVECDTVVLCWGSASDVWAMAQSRELKDWKKLGRNKQIRLRGLIVGPPSDDVKADFVELCPKSEIDVVVDLTAQEHPTPDALARLDPG